MTAKYPTMCGILSASAPTRVSAATSTETLPRPAPSALQISLGSRSPVTSSRPEGSSLQPVVKLSCVQESGGCSPSLQWPCRGCCRRRGGVRPCGPSGRASTSPTSGTSGTTTSSGPTPDPPTTTAATAAQAAARRARGPGSQCAECAGCAPACL